MLSGKLGELTEIVARLRTIGTDEQTVEVKSSVQRIPKSVPETLSAFANGSGGLLILGLDENKGFAPASGFRAQSIRDALAGICSDRMQPPLRPDIEIVPVDDSFVVIAWVEALRPVDKPCHVKERGIYQGSYIRTGDGDRRLSHYEIDRLLEEHRQPRWDEEMVEYASVFDLDEALMVGVASRQRGLRPQLFSNGNDEDILQRLRVLRRDEAGVLRPTLAGLLALGSYPQEFFPRLTVTFAAFPGLTKAPVIEGRERMLDSITLTGPIPMLVKDTVAAVARNMRVGAVMDGAFRKDIPDYPLAAVREAVTNALMHRDLSDLARGTQVQVNLYADRMEFLNPGGLYGTVTVDGLGKPGISSARNQRLSALLEDTPFADGGMVAENRGSGYAAIEAALKHERMPPPIVRDEIASFSLTINRTRISNARPESHAAGLRSAILEQITESGSASSGELVNQLGMSRSAIAKHLNALIEEGVVMPTERGRSPRQRYRLAD
jgi:ATP-dependent DNA helicase RecG